MSKSQQAVVYGLLTAAEKAIAEAIQLSKAGTAQTAGEWAFANEIYSAYRKIELLRIVLMPEIEQ